MRVIARSTAVFMLALFGQAGAACSSVTETGTQRGYPGASGAPDASAPGAQIDGAPRSVSTKPSADAGVHPRHVAPDDAGLGAAPDAATPSEGGARSDVDGVAPGAASAGRDAASDVAADTGPSVPDCTCPDLGFFLDATIGASSLHLTAPYTLGIYCTETTVQLGHPPCGGVYRLSACNGPDGAPPCMYMAVNRPSTFLLGDFVDASGEPWDILQGDIVPDPPSGRVETGTFSATMRPRADGDLVMFSGSFRACVTRMPACSG